MAGTRDLRIGRHNEGSMRYCPYRVKAWAARGTPTKNQSN